MSLKQTVLAILLSELFICQCSPSNKGNASSSVILDTTPIKYCPEPSVKQIYFQKGCNNDVCGYTHFLMLSSYLDSCFNEYDFVFIADKYLDTVKTNTPVSSIQIVKQFEFNPENDSRDMDPLNENSIVRIGYTDSTMNLKVPKIDYITVWTNGIRKTISYIESNYRKKHMDLIDGPE
jgi:hypothetical protein